VASRLERGSAEQAFAVWITGLPASGKSTIAGALKNLLDERGVDVALLESDVLREIFSENPRYGESDRDEFYRRMIWVGVLLTRHGVPVIFDATANRRVWRDEARRQIPKFAEVYVDVPLKTCIERDPKGIYRSAAEGRADNVPGVQEAYEPPENPELVIDGTREAPVDAARRIIAVQKDKGYWP
jgi:adenylylsulfate kinase